MTQVMEYRGPRLDVVPRNERGELMGWMGVDPGVSGGLVWITDGRVVAAKMGESEAETWEWFERMGPLTVSAVVEKVGAMPKQGVSSTFTFGKSYGIVLGCLAAARIPYELVRPAVWQKQMMCLSGGDKRVTKQKAEQLYPEVKVVHWMADALLIATYARRLWKANM